MSNCPTGECRLASSSICWTTGLLPELTHLLIAFASTAIGCRGKFVKKLRHEIFELRVKEFDRIFRILFFYQPGMLIVITSGFQKKTQETPASEIARAEKLRKLWMKYRNRYTGSLKESEAILKEFGL